MPFRDVLTEEEIQAAFVAENACFGEDEDDIYTPALTLWGWLSQVDACGEGSVLRRGGGADHGIVRGPGPQAPIARYGSLLPRPSEVARSACSGDWSTRWVMSWSRACRRIGCGWERHVKMADGTTLLTPDTDANQDSLAAGAHAEARPGVSHPADGRVHLLGHGRLVRAGDRTVQGQGDGRDGLVARVVGAFPARRCVVGRLCLLLVLHAGVVAGAEAWTW